MKLIALVPTRGDAWVIGFSVRVLLEFVDEVLIFQHMPLDCSYEDNATFDILQELPKEVRLANRVTIVGDVNPEWHEMQHRQFILKVARAMGGTHMVIADSDEFLTGNLQPQIRGLISRLLPGQGLDLPLYNVRHGIDEYHSNGLWGNRSATFAFADSPELSWQGRQFHHREPFGMKPLHQTPIAHGAGGIIHLWGASEARIVEKHRAYRISEHLMFPDTPVADIEQMYSQYALDRPPMTPDKWTFAPVPSEWLDPYMAYMSHLDIDRTPWQKQWCDEQIAKYGRERFAGLSV